MLHGLPAVLAVAITSGIAVSAIAAESVLTGGYQRLRLAESGAMTLPTVRGQGHVWMLIPCCR